jgi:hypothetical protein
MMFKHRPAAAAGVPAARTASGRNTRDVATMFEHSPDLLQFGTRIRPQICIELIASALSKVSSANGNFSAEPWR